MIHCVRLGFYCVNSLELLQYRCQVLAPLKLNNLSRIFSVEGLESKGIQIEPKLSI